MHGSLTGCSSSKSTRTVTLQSAAHSAQVADSAKAVAEQCDITVAMLADPQAAEAVATGPDGIAAGMGSGQHCQLIPARHAVVCARASAHPVCCRQGVCRCVHSRCRHSPEYQQGRLCFATWCSAHRSLLLLIIMASKNYNQ